MRVPSGKTDQYIYFVAYDSTDKVTRKTGLATFTVYRSRNGAADVIYTTPTVTEIDATNMPGVYALLLDEDTTIAAGSDSEEYCVQISATGMTPITRTVELYRRSTTTGRTLDVSAAGEAGIDLANIGSPTTVVDLSGVTIKTATDVATATTAIKAKTDSLTFTVAGQVDANAESMNAAAILGNGTALNLWRGA